MAQTKQILVVYSPEGANPSYLDEVLGYVTRKLCDDEYCNVRIIPLHEQSITCLLFNYDPLDLIVVVGGDKTTRAVLESLAQTRLTVPVGLVPLGNDTLLAGKLGIKPCHEREELEEALQVINGGDIMPLDLGKINGRYFAIDAVIGNIPPVVLAPESDIQRNLGVLSHLTPFVQSMGKRSMLCRFIIESEGFYRLASSIFVTNARGIGPSGDSGIDDLSDGYLYLCIVNPLTLADYGRLAYRFGAWYLSGTVSGDTPFLIKKVRQVRIEVEKEAPTMVDGEIWGTTPADIEVVPGAVNVIVPPRTTATTVLQDKEHDALEKLAPADLIESD